MSSQVSRSENVWRIGEDSKLFADMSAVVLTAFTSSCRKDRDTAYELDEKAELEFVEVSVNAPLSAVEGKDG